MHRIEDRAHRTAINVCLHPATAHVDANKRPCYVSDSGNSLTFDSSQQDCPESQIPGLRHGTVPLRHRATYAVLHTPEYFAKKDSRLS